jgi:hypothetical protein
MAPLPNLDGADQLVDQLVDQSDLDPPEEEMHISPPSSRRTPKKRAPSWAAAASLPGTGQLTGQATAGAEGERGVLREGMAADFAAFSVDPVTCEPAALLTARTLLTVVAGREVYAP